MSSSRRVSRTPLRLQRHRAACDLRVAVGTTSAKGDSAMIDMAKKVVNGFYQKKNASASKAKK